MIPPPTVVNDHHRHYGVVACVTVLGSVSTAFTLLRLRYRYVSRAFGYDDYAIIPALMMYLGWSIMALYVNTNAGVGKPLWEITLGEFVVWFKGIVGSALLYPAMSASIRISILLFYLRIFGQAVTSVRYTVWALLALQGVYVIVYSILPIFIAKPFNKIWHPLERGKYMNDWYYYYLQVALFSTSLAFDIILLVLPIYPVTKLQMTVKRRMGVIAIFMCGAAASVAAAYKLAIFVTQMERFTSIDPKWLEYEMSTLVPPQFDQYGKTFWIPSQVEPSVALIGAALPALRPMLQGAMHSVIKTISSGTNSSSRTGDSPGSQKHPSGIHTPERSLLQSKNATYIELEEAAFTRPGGQKKFLKRDVEANHLPAHL